MTIEKKEYGDSAELVLKGWMDTQGAPMLEQALGELKRRTAELGMPYTAIDRGNTGWEVVPVGYTKATGIECLRKKLGVALENCYAFGDSRNDLSMLRHVPNSIAMGNASEDVKAACAWVTARPEEDGIEKAMAHFGLI